MFSPNAAWLAKLRDGPLDALEECRAAFQAGEVSRNARLYATIAALVLFVDALAGSPADEAAFRAHPFWRESRRVLKTKRLSLLAIRNVLGAARAEGALYEQARSYARAVEHFRQGGFDTNAVVACLQRSGIYGLLDELAGDGQDPEAGSGGGDRDASADDDGGDDGASGDSAPSDSSGDEGEASGDAASNDAPDEVGSRAWWATFLAHAKEIHAAGRVPIVIAGAWGDLDDLRRRSRSRPAVLVVSQGEPADSWATYACQRVERTRDPGHGRDVQVAPRPSRLFPPISPAGDGAGRPAEPALLQSMM